MAEPTLTDYVRTMLILFEKFVQEGEATAKAGHPYTFSEKAMISLFVLCQFRRIFHFKAQRRWLKGHPEILPLLEWTSALIA